MTITVRHGTKRTGEDNFHWSISINKYSSVLTLKISPIHPESPHTCGYPIFEGYYQTEEKALRAMRSWFRRNAK